MKARARRWAGPAWSLPGLALALALSWSLTPILGGQSYAPPLWFGIPIVWSAVRLGARAGVPVALLSGVLAGPLTPADMATGAQQPLVVWTIRTLFFVLLAVVAARGVRRLRVTALHDPLTGLVNRAALEESLPTALANARRAQSPLGLVYLDLDDFKLVNDSLGHASGDELLREVAARLQAARRAGDVLARHGGDEFIVVLGRLEGGSDEEEVERSAMAAVQRLIAALDAPFTVGGVELQVGCSAGLSLFPHDACDADTLHRHADTAMYSAKRSRTGSARYVPSKRDPLVRLSRAARLRQAVDAGDLELHYQPIFKVGSGLVGLEALARWRDGDAGFVPPSEFITIAEETGTIDALGEWALSDLCGQASAWSALGLWPHYGLNVAPRQLRQPRFAERVTAVLDAHRLDANHFVLELTESAWTLERDRTLPALNALRDAGMRLAIDDFGAGYSSLSRLHELPVDVIKVDRAFLDGVPARAQSVAIMTAIFDLAAACGADVVAEGVETTAQYAFLVERGCSLAQGYALGRPAPAAVTTALLRDRLVASRREGVVTPLAA